MADPTPDQTRRNIIAFGRSMVKIIEGADYLYPNARRLERLLLKVTRWLYKMRLRQLVATLPANISAEILIASDNIAGPVNDVSMN